MMNVDKLIASLGGALGLLGAGVAIWAQLQTIKQEELVSALDGDVRRLEAKLQERRLEYEVSIRVYEKLEKIDHNDDKQLQAAGALLAILPNSEFKKQLGLLLESISAQSNSVTAAEVGKLANFVVADADTVREISKKPVSSATYSDIEWDYDVFWCEVAGVSKQDNEYRIKAEAVADIIREKAGGRVGYVRSREIPVSVNSRAGYRIEGNVIRSDSYDSEMEKSKAIKDLLNGEEMFADDPVEVEVANGQTQWYISAFFCPDQLQN